MTIPSSFTTGCKDLNSPLLKSINVSFMLSFTQTSSAWLSSSTVYGLWMWNDLVVMHFTRRATSLTKKSNPLYRFLNLSVLMNGELTRAAAAATTFAPMTSSEGISTVDVSCDTGQSLKSLFNQGGAHYHSLPKSASAGVASILVPKSAMLSADFTW